MSTLERLKQYIDFKGISIRAFETSVGFSNGSFSSQLKKNRTIGVDRIEYILQKYPDINPEWLLTGNGSMIKKDRESINQNLNGNNNIMSGGDTTMSESNLLYQQLNDYKKLIADKDMQIKEKDNQINKLLEFISKLK